MAIALESRAHYFRAGISWNLIPTSLLSETVSGRLADCRAPLSGDSSAWSDPYLAAFCRLASLLVAWAIQRESG